VTLAEELAHLVLGHPPSAIDTSTGVRTHDHDRETEAYAVGVAAVAPYGSLFGKVKRGESVDEIADAYEISNRCAQYRINRAGLGRMHRKRTGN
jgi:hypothetical protein